MAQRRTLQGQSPVGMPFTGSGTTGKTNIDEQDPSMMTESPETRRRRLMPAIGFPQQQPNGIQQLLALMKGNSNGG